MFQGYSVMIKSHGKLVDEYVTSDNLFKILNNYDGREMIINEYSSDSKIPEFDYLRETGYNQGQKHGVLRFVNSEISQNNRILQFKQKYVDPIEESSSDEEINFIEYTNTSDIDDEFYNE